MYYIFKLISLAQYHFEVLADSLWQISYTYQLGDSIREEERKYATKTEMITLDKSGPTT